MIQFPGKRRRRKEETKEKKVLQTFKKLMDRWSGKKVIENRPDARKSSGKNGMKVSDKRKSSNGKEVIGTSSKIYGSTSSSVQSEKLMLSQIPNDDAEVEILEASIRKKDKRRVHGSGKVKTTEAECSNLSSSSKIKRGFKQRFGLIKQESSSQATSSNMIGKHGGGNRGCSTILSSVIPSGFGLENRPSRKVDSISKKKTYGESSSSSSGSGKNTPEPSGEERCRGFIPRGSLSDSRRHAIMNDDNDFALVGRQRLVNRSNSWIRFPNGGNGRHGLSSITTTEMSQTETPNSLSSPVSLELFPGFPEYGVSGSLSSQSSFQSYTLDGISEILPEINRIEQDIELDYEELFIMDSGILLGDFSFYDQHRDMRLDIDNMSYEELLALEENIGTVSTALTEEAISKCLKTNIYQMTPSSSESIAKSPCDHKQDAKCSICQEEYTIGDEVGKLHCDHTYHFHCVQSWLRLKSWCPICRANAETLSK